MKKKLLSLVLAGAMVASTSVSAFADTTVTSTNGKDIDHKIDVLGNVAKTEDNSTLPGTISVTVPTTANFIVDKEGVLDGSRITVTNVGTEKVEVYAHEFIDTGKSTGITVKRSLASGDQRNNITLYLSGDEGNAYFGSNVDRGIYKNDTSEESVGTGDGIKLATLNSNGTVDLQLQGAGATNGDLDNAIQEKFTLKLKIKKAAQ